MKKTMLKFTFILSFVSLFVSCYPGNDVNIGDLDTTSTFYKNSDFNSPPKSAMIYWDVTQLKGQDGDNIDYNGEIDDEILNTTLNNMVDLYGVDNVWIFTNNDQPIPVPSNPNVKIIFRNDPVPEVDAAIIPAIVLREKTSVGIIYPPCLPGWWGWWCYPPVVGVSSYGVGTVVLSMSTSFDGAVTNPSWTALMRGLLSSSASNNSTRTISGIDQAFTQSPYLN